MRRTVLGLRCILAASIATLVSFTPSRARSATLNWDVTPGDAGVITDGSGEWTDLLGNWNTGTADTTWNNATLPPDNAVFGAGGTAGTVTVMSPITVGDITFNTVTDSYILTGTAITLSSAAPTITVNDDAARISAGLISAAGLIKAGTGTLTLATTGFGALDITGGITVNAGTLEFNGTGGFAQSPFLMDQTITANTGGTILITTPHALGGDNNFAGNKVVLNGGTLTLNREQYFGTDGVQMTGATINGTNEIRSAPGASWTVNASAATSTIASRVNLVADLTLNVADGAAATDLLVSGAITNVGSLTKLGAGSLTLTGANTFTGATNVTEGTLLTGSTNALGRGALTVTSTLDLGGFSQSVGGLSGTGTITSNAPGNATLTVGNGNGEGAFTGIIQDGGIGNVVSLTKVGTGTLSLAGTTTYTGTTTVSGGRLTVDAGSINSSSHISVASGAYLNPGPTLARGTGQILTAGHAGALPLTETGDVVGNVTVSGGTINVGQSGAKTLTFGNNLTINGGSTVNYDLASATTSGGDINDRLDVAGTLNVSGAISVGISPLNGPLSTSGAYTLMTAPTINNTATFSAKDAANYRQTFNFTSTPTAIQMGVSGNAANLTWAGATSAVWNVNNATNWSGAADQKFFQLDTVTFDDSGSNNDVSVEGVVNPATVTINNTTKAYTLTGTGSISSGALTKSGTGIATINVPVIFGAITVNAGTLSAASPFGGGGTMTIAPGATYQYTGSTASLNQALAFSGTGAGIIDVNTAGTVLTLAPNTSVTSTGGLTKIGAGTLNISSAQGFAGNLTVNGGILEFAGSFFNGGLFPAGRTITVNSGGTLLISNVHALSGNNGGAPNTIVLNGGKLTVNREQYIGATGLTMTGATVDGTSEIRSIDAGSKFTINAAATSSTIASRIWARGDVNFDVANGTAADDLVVSGAITPGLPTGGIIKNGPGRALLTGANTYTGGTTINTGVLALGATASLTTNRVTVASGAQFDVTAMPGGFILNGGQTLTAGHTGAAFNDVVGSVNALFGSIINVGGNNAVRTMTVSGDLNLGDSTINYDLSNNAASGNDAINVGGALNLSGVTMIDLFPISSALAQGNYTLMTAGSVNGSGANLAVLGAATMRPVFTFGTTATTVTLGVSGTTANLAWAGGAATKAWDINSTANWSGAADQKYFNLDAVTFDDSGSDAQPIDVSVAVNPASLAFNNSAKNYTFTGFGTIFTSGFVTKSGSGTVVINVPVTFNNTVTINEGTLATSNVIAPGAIPGSTLTIGGGTYRYDGLTDTMSRPIVLTAANSGIGVNFAGEILTITGGTSGTGGLVKSGPGTVTLLSTGTIKQNFAGPITVNEGVLEFRGGFFGGNPFAAGKTLTVNSGGTVIVTDAHALGGGNGGAPNSIILNGGTLTVNREQYIGATGLTMTAGTVDGPNEIRTVDAGSTITINASATSSTIASNISVRGNLTLNVADGTASDDLLIAGNALSGIAGSGIIKNGAGRVVLNGTNAYTGATTINAGTLAIGVNGSVVSNLIAVAPGAQFDVSATLGFAIGSGKTLRAGRNGTPATDVVGNVTISSGGTFNVGGNGAARTATFGNNLALEAGSTVEFDLSTAATLGGGVNDLVNVLGTLSTSGGATNVGVNAIGGNLAASPYTLFTASSFTGTAANLQIAGGASSYRQTFTFDTTTVPNTVRMSVSGTAANLTWVGGSGGNAWDVNNTTNWSGMADQKFFQLDSVTFDDTNAAANNAVTLTGSLRPGAVAVNSSTNNFTLAGSGLITGGASLTKSGTGTLTLSTANSFTGLTTISGGTVKLGHATALGTGDKGTIVEAGAALDFNGINITGEAVTISGTGIGGNGALVNSNATTGVGIISAPLTLAGDSTVGGANRINVSGPGSAITSNGNNYTLTKKGAGLMSVFSGTQVSLQNIVVDGGTLEFQSSDTVVDNAIPGTITVNNGATLGIRFFSGTPTILKPIVLNAGATFGTVRTGPGSNTIGADITLNGASTIQAGQAGNAADPLILTGVISGSGEFSKTGGSDLTLAGTNTYTGPTTVTSGKLIVTGSIAGSAATVNSGATLAGNGSVGSLTINGGATLTPGVTTGVLNTGNLTLGAPTSHLTLEINGITAGTLYDQVNVTGAVSLNGDFQLSLGTFNPADFIDKFYIIVNDGTDAVTGTFAGLSEGGTFLQGGQNWQIFYGGDFATGATVGGNDVVLVAVPEPGPFSFVALAGLGCLALRRRRVRLA